MRIDQLIELLQVFPNDLRVYVQTSEGDLLSPLGKNHIWMSDAYVDQKYKSLEPAKLCITAFVKGGRKYDTKNDKSGVLVVYEEHSSRDTNTAEGG